MPARSTVLTNKEWDWMMMGKGAKGARCCTGQAVTGRRAG